MKSASIKGFFSCSFKPEDKNINDFFKAVCEGLDINCYNVDGGYTETPADKALSMICDADVIIAIATKRNRFDGVEKFSMPEAVSNEISFAYSNKKPLLIIKEDAVRVEGFLANYGTHLSFSRESIWDSEFLRKVVHSVHNLKLGALSDHELILSQEITEFIAEKVSHLYELEKEAGGFCWQHSIQRTIKFVKNFNKPLKISRWNDSANGRSSEGLKPIDLIFEIINSSRKFEFTIDYEERNAYGVIANVNFSPAPVEGDVIEYFVSFRGEHLCATYLEDTDSRSVITLDGKRYEACDGVVPVNRAKDIEIQFCFPREYGLRDGDLKFFAASFSQGIDYIVESEIERAKIDVKTIGGKKCITAKISSPLLRHVYGVTWVPPRRPAVVV